MSAQPFGIDFGGSGIKGAPVDLDEGEFAEERGAHRHPRAGDARGGGEGLRRAARAFDDSDGPVGRDRARAS